jgi:hypothetical protein
LDGIAETGVDVGDDRGILHFANRTHHLQVDVHREDIGIGHSVGRGQLKATTPYRIETSTGGELGRERVVGCHRHCRPVDIELGAQRCRPCAVLIHMIIPCCPRLEELFCQFRLRQNRAQTSEPAGAETQYPGAGCDLPRN